MSNVCWSCGQVPTQLFCEHCDKLQPLPQQNAFERMGVPVSYDVDQDLVEQHYFRAQTRVHPDRFVGSFKTEKVYSAQHAAALNSAYETLKNPIKRAEEILRIQGFIQPNIEQQTLDDQELLLEIIELREALLEANDNSRLTGLKRRVEGLFEDNVFEISKAFGNKDYDEAAKLLNRMRYLTKIRSEVLHKMVA